MTSINKYFGYDKKILLYIIDGINSNKESIDWIFNSFLMNIGILNTKIEVWKRIFKYYKTISDIPRSPYHKVDNCMNDLLLDIYNTRCKNIDSSFISSLENFLNIKSVKNLNCENYVHLILINLIKERKIDNHFLDKTFEKFNITEQNKTIKFFSNTPSSIHYFIDGTQLCFHLKKIYKESTRFNFSRRKIDEIIYS